MSNGQDPASVQEPQQAPAPEAPPAPAPAGMAAKEIEDGKAFAVLSYVLNLLSLPFFLVPLITRDNTFSLYHAKQCLLVWLADVVVVTILFATCVGSFLIPFWVVFTRVLYILGIINASKGEAKPLPMIGKWAEDWFKGIQKV